MSGVGSRGGRHYRVTTSTIVADLQRTLKKMRATNLRIEQDYEKGGAVISFDRNARRYRYTNDNFKHPEDNLRAAQLSIEYLWKAVEVLGTHRSSAALEAATAAIFSGFEATPGDRLLSLPAGSWWEVLGVTQAATTADINGAYRALVRIYHPDVPVTGDVEMFRRVAAAHKKGIDAKG